MKKRKLTTNLRENLRRILIGLILAGVLAGCEWFRWVSPIATFTKTYTTVPVLRSLPGEETIMILHDFNELC